MHNKPSSNQQPQGGARLPTQPAPVPSSGPDPKAKGREQAQPEDAMAVKSTSYTHSGAAPLLQSNNPSNVGAGIGATVIDQLLPMGNDAQVGVQGFMNLNSWNSLQKKPVENIKGSFEQFKAKNKEKEEKVSDRSTVGPTPLVTRVFIEEATESRGGQPQAPAGAGATTAETAAEASTSGGWWPGGYC